MTSFKRAWTALLWMRGDTLRAARAALEAVNSAATADSLPERACLIKEISLIFWYANANQLLVSSSSFFDSVSRDTGTWRREQLADTQRRSPRAAWTGFKVATAESRSALQMLRPEMIPTESTLFLGRAATKPDSWDAARTQSMWTPATGRARRRSWCSATESKYVAKRMEGAAAERVAYVGANFSVQQASSSRARMGSSTWTQVTPAAFNLARRAV